MEPVSRSRPPTVNAAVWLSIITVAAGIPLGVAAVTSMPVGWRGPFAILGLVLPSLLLVVMSLLCLRGHNWPRALLALLFVGGLCSMAAGDFQAVGIAAWSISAISALSTVLLFTPSANRWFASVRQRRQGHV